MLSSTSTFAVLALLAFVIFSTVYYLIYFFGNVGIRDPLMKGRSENGKWHMHVIHSVPMKKNEKLSSFIVIASRITLIISYLLLLLFVYGCTANLLTVLFHNLFIYNSGIQLTQNVRKFYIYNNTQSKFVASYSVFLSPTVTKPILYL